MRFKAEISTSFEQVLTLKSAWNSVLKLWKCSALRKKMFQIEQVFVEQNCQSTITSIDIQSYLQYEFL